MPRKVPFSSKQKKKQLQGKKKAKCSNWHDEDSEEHGCNDINGGNSGKTVEQINQQPESNRVGSSRKDLNRYRLEFFKDTKESIEKGKKLSTEPHETLPEESLEVNIDEIYKPGTVLDIPKRQSWDYSLKKEELEAKEEKYFKQYLSNICQEHSLGTLSYFELNLETWRQLWRVLEMSDILLIIVDIRHPAVNFSPALYDHITKDLGKHVVLILNKIDLAPPSLVTAWQYYMKEKFPELHIVLFSSFPTHTDLSIQNPGTVIRKARKKRRSTAMGPKELCRVCGEIMKGKVDMSHWEEKIKLQMAGKEPCVVEESDEESEMVTEDCEENNNLMEHKNEGIVTIGCLGSPNVGKSSLINGLNGRKVVSVSKTPGHTKHFQTIFLTPTVRLCDCPGLVFPSLMNKQLQILSGIYPVAQVQDPYSVIRYLAQRLDIPKLLRLQPVCDSSWTAFDICEAWAQKRGFLTAKAGRPDVYRAGNNILRMAVEGKICLCLRPTGFSKMKEFWEVHQETMKLIEEVQQFKPQVNQDSSEGEEEDLSEQESSQERAIGKDKKVGRLCISNPFSLLEDEN